VNDTSKSDTAAAAKAWVDENMALVEEAYQRFLVDGTWPDVPSLQRRFDQMDIDIEVQRVVDAKPRVVWEARPLHTERLTLQLRHLMWLEKARPLVTVCVRAVQRAVESYLSDDDPPAVTSEDQLTDFPSDSDGALAMRACEVLTSFEHPSPFGGSSRNQTSWMIQVDTRFARRFRGVTTVADFVARQDEIREEMSQELGMAVGSGGRILIETGPPIPYPEDILSAEAPIEIEAHIAAEASVEAEVVPMVVAPNELEGVSSTVADPVLFLSWSGETGKMVARAFVQILKSRLEGVDVFFSPTSIDPGEDPSDRLYDDGLLGARALVVVLTQEGAGSPFAIWETAAAWARGKLVIPVFVDIEPSDVPGPLAIKVQGVHLRERERVDRAIAVLASVFGIADVPPLDDDEYGTLEAMQHEELTLIATAAGETTVTATAAGEVWVKTAHAIEDRGLTQGPYLVVKTTLYSPVPDGWTRQVEIENLGSGAAVDCGLICFGDYDSWGFERGFHLGPGAVRATDVRSSQIGPVPDALFDVSPGVGPRGDPVGRMAIVCRDVFGVRWRFLEGVPPEYWDPDDPAAPAWVRSRFFGWPSAGAS
jgi:hypothetical protein